MSKPAKVVYPFVDSSNHELIEVKDMLQFLVESEIKRQNQGFKQENKEKRGLWQFQYTETFRKLRSYLVLLQDNFSDYHDRIQYLGVIKDCIKELKNDLNKDIYKYERRICIAVHDAIFKARAEQLNEKHMEVISMSLEILFKGNSKQEDFLNVDRALRINGLSWIVGDIDE